MKKAVFQILAALICALSFSGCTVHFKASEVELDSVANTTYQLEKIDFAKG